MTRDIPNKARNTTRSAAWSSGVGIASPGSGAGAGGANLKKPYPTQTGGSALNKGRSRLAQVKEVHHNGGTTSIAEGSASPAR